MQTYFKISIPQPSFIVTKLNWQYSTSSKLYRWAFIKRPSFLRQWKSSYAAGKMALSEILGILVFVNIFSSVLSCGGGPSPCSWTTCRHEWRNDWSPGIATGQCTRQRRNAHHITQSHGGKGSCPSPTHCSPSTQYRTKCKCTMRVINLACLQCQCEKTLRESCRKN